MNDIDYIKSKNYICLIIVYIQDGMRPKKKTRKEKQKSEDSSITNEFNLVQDVISLPIM